MVIDFSESIDSRIVHPMQDDVESMNGPVSVDLRFPGGQVYRNENARVVSISRDPYEAPSLIRDVIVHTGFETPEQAADHARSLRDQWSLGEVDSLAGWLAARKSGGPGRMVVDSAKAVRRNIRDTRRDGRSLNVEYELNSDAGLTRPYWIAVTFSWW